MFFVSLLQRLGFPSVASPASTAKPSLQSPPKSDAPRPARPADSLRAERRPGTARKRGITTTGPVTPATPGAPQAMEGRGIRPQEQATSGTERRTLVKAPAHRTATSSKTASAAGKGRTTQSKPSATAGQAPAKTQPAAPAKAVKSAVPASKPAARASSTAAVPASAKKTVVPKAAPAKTSKPVAPKAAAPKQTSAAKTAAPAPKAAKVAVKAAAPVVAKTRAAAPAAKAAKGTKPAPTPAKAPAAKAAAPAPAAVKPAAKAAPVKAPAATAAPARATVTPPPAPVPPVVVEPTPRPLGKRAAKKVMMEQMTQAAVVPTHAPDAAKATFFTMNERVMTPPAPSAVQKDPKRANNWKTVPAEQLTDQDILAMPDSEYMNDVQLAFFRRKLSQLKADMLANAGETTEHLREDTVVVPDPADRATIEEEHALELRTRDRERKLLKKIEQSIARIDSGDYGYCDETGEPIGVGRLLARPTASLSLEAQQRRELKQKMFGD